MPTRITCKYTFSSGIVINIVSPSHETSPRVSFAVFYILDSLASSPLHLYSRIPGSIDINRREPICIALPCMRSLRGMSGSHTLRNDRADRPEYVSSLHIET